MDLSKIYENLGIDAFDISRQHRDRLKSEGKFDEAVSLQYGEVDIMEFVNYLELNIPKDFTEDRTFVDIGCGTGKPVFAAAASDCGFSKVIGIEIVPSLLDQAKAVHKQYLDCSARNNNCHIDLLEGDCFTFDSLWMDAAVLFLPITCFTSEMVQQCAEKIVNLVDKAYIITTSTIEDLVALCDCEPRLKRIGKSVRLKYGKGKMEFSVFYKASKRKVREPVVIGKEEAEGKEGKECGDQNDNGKRQSRDDDNGQKNKSKRKKA